MTPFVVIVVICGLDKVYFAFSQLKLLQHKQSNQYYDTILSMICLTSLCFLDQVDVFSFGIVLWEILTGEEPYANMHYGAIIGMCTLFSFLISSAMVVATTPASFSFVLETYCKYSLQSQLRFLFLNKYLAEK